MADPDRRSFIVGALALSGVASAAQSEPRLLAPLSDGRVARAGGDIVEVVLIGATTRYEHFVLGSRHEASGVRVTRSDGQTVELILSADSVFEDREPRLVDLDGDGRNEVLLVRSRQSSGSALAVLGLREGRLTILAETAPNGGPRRWLNPAGVGHFTATDQLQVAMVRMPHVVGRLEFYGFDGKSLTLKAAFEGVSNHRIGLPSLQMSAVVAAPDRATDLLVLPSLDRRALLVIDASGDRVRIRGRAPLPAAADGDIAIVGTGADTMLNVPLANGVISKFSLTKILASG